MHIFCSLNYAVNGMKDKPQIERKIFANHIPDRGCVSRYVKTPKNSIIRKQPSKKQIQKIFDRYAIQEDIWMAN